MSELHGKNKSGSEMSQECLEKIGKKLAKIFKVSIKMRKKKQEMYTEGKNIKES